MSAQQHFASSAARQTQLLPFQSSSILAATPLALVWQQLARGRVPNAGDSAAPSTLALGIGGLCLRVADESLLRSPLHRPVRAAWGRRLGRVTDSEEIDKPIQVRRRAVGPRNPCRSRGCIEAELADTAISAAAQRAAWQTGRFCASVAVRAYAAALPASLRHILLSHTVSYVVVALAWVVLRRVMRDGEM